jgi:hypothetical protein
MHPGMKPPWKPGECGNPLSIGVGRPKGIVNAKTVLTGRILTDLQEMWSALTVKEKVDWARKNMSAALCPQAAFLELLRELGIGPQ